MPSSPWLGGVEPDGTRTGHHQFPTDQQGLFVVLYFGTGSRNSIFYFYVRFLISKSSSPLPAWVNLSVASLTSKFIPPAYNKAYGYCGGLYNLNARELQTTETDLSCIQRERGRIGRLLKSLTTMPLRGKPRPDRAECV